MSRIIRTISSDASVVCSAIDGKDIVSQIERLHVTSAVVTAALGRLAMGASLMGFGLKGENDKITLRIDGGGPAGMLTAVSDSFGNVKASVENPIVELPLNSKGKLDVRGAVGVDGMFTVIKDLGLKEPYMGQVPIVSGEIAEDITNYLAVSEQVPSVCALGVLVNPDLTVSLAGGFLIEVLPFASDEVIDQIERNIAEMQSVTKLLQEGYTAEQIAMKALDGLEPNVLDDFDVFYKCNCSREFMEKKLCTLSKEDITDLSKDPYIETKCPYCNSTYRFTNEELLNLIK